MTSRSSIVAAAFLAVLVGCQTAERTPIEPGDPAPLAAATTPTSPGSAGPGPGSCGAEQGAGPGACGAARGAPAAGCGAPAEAPGCGCGSEDPVPDRIEAVRDPATGNTLQLAGSKLTGVARVTVQELIAHPDRYAGKTVRVEGDVAAMCHHKRRWFAVQEAGDRAGRTVRVVTAPAFLVPAGAIGRKARTEGTVELIDVPEAARQHYAAQHGLTEAAAAKSVVIRASGAEFI